MALFQKKLEMGNSQPLYTIGNSKTVLIIGLGNTGKEYAGTRHNIGFEAVDYFAAKNEFPDWIVKKDLKCHVTSHMLGANRVILCKPTTFMNLSGEAVQAIQRFYRVYNPETVAIYDELAIKFGQIRARVGGESAGHNGVKSLIQHLGEDFGRLRIGIGSQAAKKAEADKFVLSKFSKAEQGHLSEILRETNAMLTEFIFGGALPHDTRNVI